jgi:hypothetical protein
MCTTSLHLSSATYIACAVANCNRGWTSLTYSWRSSFIHWVTLLVSTHTCNRKQQRDLLRREWWSYVKLNEIWSREWQNSNPRALLRDAGVVCYKRSQVLSVGTGKPRKVSVTFAAENQTKILWSNNHSTQTCGPVCFGDHTPRIRYDQRNVYGTLLASAER